MFLCPRCQKSRRTKDTIERDPKNKRKRWLITSCMVCGYHKDIEEFKSNRIIDEDE